MRCVFQHSRDDESDIRLAIVISSIAGMRMAFRTWKSSLDRCSYRSLEDNSSRELFNID